MREGGDGGARTMMRQEEEGVVPATKGRMYSYYLATNTMTRRARAHQPSSAVQNREHVVHLLPGR